MPLNGTSNNVMQVTVIHDPLNQRLKIIVHLGEIRDDRVHLAYVQLLNAVRRMQEVTRD